MPDINLNFISLSLSIHLFCHEMAFCLLMSTVLRKLFQYSSLPMATDIMLEIYYTVSHFCLSAHDFNSV